MENQDLDLIGKTVGNMPYKIGIVDKDGKLKNQFVVNASTNRIDIPQSSLGSGDSGLPSTVNLFKGSAVGDILLSGPTQNYDNIQDGLSITLSNLTSITVDAFGNIGSSAHVRADLSSIGLKQINIPKEKLVVNSSFDISDQLSQYIGKAINAQYQNSSGDTWYDISSAYSSYGLSFSILSFGGATIKVLPNTTLSMNLIVNVQEKEAKDNTSHQGSFSIPVIQVNTYKN